MTSHHESGALHLASSGVISRWIFRRGMLRKRKALISRQKTGEKPRIRFPRAREPVPVCESAHLGGDRAAARN